MSLQDIESNADATQMAYDDPPEPMTGDELAAICDAIDHEAWDAAAMAVEEQRRVDDQASYLSHDDYHAELWDESVDVWGDDELPPPDPFGERSQAISDAGDELYGEAA